MNFTKRRHRLLSLVAIAAITLAFTPIGSKTVSAEPAEQVVFSGIGVATQGFVSVFGFWIWCSAEGNGLYADFNACRGSVYLYRTNLTVGVNGFIEEEADGTYTMRVFPNQPDKQPDFLAAGLRNLSPEIQHGPNNTVVFNVFTSNGISIGRSTTAVVVVTGPGDE